MYAQKEKERPEQSMYSTGIKEANKLESQYSTNANIVQKAYEAAVSELKYSDKELMDHGKSKMVAKLMFSNKYLGNEKFNPLIAGQKDFAKKGEIAQQEAYQQMLGINLDNFVGGQGIIERFGGLRRATIANAVDRHYDGKTANQLMAWAWQKAYKPDKSLSENMESYANILRQDPILAHTGAKLDSGKFQSVDDIAQALSTSLTGQTSREMFQYRHGAKFN